MKRFAVVLLVLAMGIPAVASSLGSNARAAIPSNVQQIINVDYRRLNNNDTATALKNKVLSDSLKQFEEALKGIGIVPERDVDQLTFATYRHDKLLRTVGVAQGVFSTRKIAKTLTLKKIKPTKYRASSIYPMSGGLSMTFLDDNTLMFGTMESVKDGLDARDGESDSLNSNQGMTDIISGIDQSAPVWSVLDQQGTQNMLRSAMGDASKLADYDMVKKSVRGSRYVMDFGSNITFDLDVLTSDSMTAATLSSLLKAAVLYRKYTASPVEKAALEDVTVDSDSDVLKMHFKSDDKSFQNLLNSQLFAAVSH